MTAKRRSCPACGCLLASDHLAPVCSPCERAYGDRRAAGYLPACDPELRARVLAVLLEHRGRPVNIYQALGLWPAGPEEWIAVKGHVRYWRRHGHKIAGRYHKYVYRQARGPRT